MKKLFFLFLLACSVLNGADIFKLVQAVDRNDTVTFKQMVQTISDANTARSDNNKSILMYASWVGNGDMVEYLVRQGADINAQDSSNATALHLAIWKDHTDIALFLLDHGASSTIMSVDGMMASDIAMIRSNTKVMERIESLKPKLKSLF
ncbi:MAG: ankyrin repeat domain-containing protein [Sulfuricurvum sp.]|uniref:ankyrin repeat domain-containing protein n=1 Tax=Sulfuricurvum sp. TaxID=2025608 RepID=UPI002627611F|nr:ankyrin repeat domain-containing protein [Sulfuricurvum sp.]MDD2830056.1 ankyrin repeat domain-containing protein [Sulfuricurvum sp.]MDD4950636.1 ankyrin repeat domain-containing protein [Sulfuricurvum sp.]